MKNISENQRYRILKRAIYLWQLQVKDGGIMMGSDGFSLLADDRETPKAIKKHHDAMCRVLNQVDEDIDLLYKRGSLQ